MNPILLKPESHSRSQVIVMGRPLAATEAREYYYHRTGFLEIVHHALNTLRHEYDLVIIEGAGSPVELPMDWTAPAAASRYSTIAWPCRYCNDDHLHAGFC